MTINRKEQLRANRRHAVQGWMSGGDGSPRWLGDDGRALSFQDITNMRLALLEGGLAAAEATKYRAMVDAQQAEFESRDAEYEAAKLAEGL